MSKILVVITALNTYNSHISTTSQVIETDTEAQANHVINSISKHYGEIKGDVEYTVNITRLI